MANELKQIWSASTTTVISLAADLTNASNTYGSDGVTTMLTLDNSVELYPYAKAVFTSPNGFAVAPTAGATIDLYMTEVAVDGSDDEQPAPGSGDILYLSKYVGSFVVDNQTAANKFVKAIVISLEGVKKAKFYILNNSGQTLDYVASSAITVKITPFTYAPA